jgi:hypothetical protein
VDLARWISWDNAWKQGHRAGRSLEHVAAQLKGGLASGKIPAIAEVIAENGETETIVLKPEFWSTVHIGVENILGDCVTWRPKRGSALPGGIAQKSKPAIFLGREVIDAMWSTEQAASAAPQGRNKRPPGPPPVNDWPALLGRYIIMRQNAGDNVTRNDSKLADEFCEYCSENFNGWQPDQSAVRGKISDWLKLIIR